jgi:transposase
MWLTGRLVPDHKTIADFRKDNGPAIRKVWARFVELCRKMGLPHHNGQSKSEHWEVTRESGLGRGSSAAV